MKYDLMYCSLGNGLTVCNRAVEEHGDYKKVAHISPDRNVTFYDKKLPDNIKRDITSVAKTCDMAVSATQSWMKVFHTPPAKFKVGDMVLDTNSNGVIIGKKTVIAVDSISYSDSGYGYYLEPTDTPWYAVKEEDLKPA